MLINNFSKKDLIYLILLTTIFGSSSAFSKLTLNFLNPFIAAGSRFFIASISIAIWAKFKNKNFTIKQKKRFPLYITSLAFCTQIFLSYIGLNNTYASRGVLIANMVPFIVMVLSHFFTTDDKITKNKLIGCLIAFIGIFLIIYDKNINFSILYGDMCIILAVVIWSCTTVYTKKIIKHYSSFQLTFYPMIFSSFLFIVLGVITQENIFSKTNLISILVLLYQGVIGTAFGFVTWNTFLKKYGASKLHSFIFLTPISGIITSNILLKEKINDDIFLSLILIVVGLLIVNKQ